MVCGGWWLTVGNVGLLVWCLWESFSVKGNVSVGEGWGSLGQKEQTYPREQTYALGILVGHYAVCSFPTALPGIRDCQTYVHLGFELFLTLLNTYLASPPGSGSTIAKSSLAISAYYTACCGIREHPRDVRTTAFDRGP